MATLAPPVAARLMRRLSTPATLTAREVEVLRAFAKLGVDDRTHAVTVARQDGFLDA